MNINLRKFTKFVDKTFIEGGKEAKEPVLLVSVAAVFKNPCPCQGFLKTAATETNKTGSLASLPPSMKVLSTNFVNFLKFISIILYLVT